MKEVFHRGEGALVNQACLCSGMVNKLPVNILISPLADDLMPVDHHSASA